MSFGVLGLGGRDEAVRWERPVAQVGRGPSCDHDGGGACRREGPGAVSMCQMASASFRATTTRATFGRAGGPGAGGCARRLAGRRGGVRRGWRPRSAPSADSAARSWPVGRGGRARRTARRAGIAPGVAALLPPRTRSPGAAARVPTRAPRPKYLRARRVVTDDFMHPRTISGPEAGQRAPLAGRIRPSRGLRRPVHRRPARRPRKWVAS